MLLRDSLHWFCASCLFFGTSALASRALGVESVPRATREYRLEFSADRVEVDGELGTLDLDGHVRVQTQRYLLKSPHLDLKRG
ncbi:MAG TPA: hypothetical protein VGM44_23495, partial [Polyangiaceae bacterium]